jgi:hypothetical protein
MLLVQNPSARAELVGQDACFIDEVDAGQAGVAGTPVSDKTFVGEVRGSDVGERVRLCRGECFGLGGSFNFAE